MKRLLTCLLPFVLLFTFFITKPAQGQIVDVSPSTFDFGDVVVGATSAPQTFTVTNLDPVNPLTITSADVVTGTDFNRISEDCTLAPILPLDTCTIDVEFSPTVTGPLSDDLQIDSDDPATPTLVPLDGNGVQPAVGLVPASLSFGSVAIGFSTPSQSVTLTNTGTSALDVTSVSIVPGTEFTLVNEDCVAAPIAPSGTCTITAKFSPTTLPTGPKAADIEILSDAPTSPNTVDLDGNALSGPVATVTPAGVAFGNVPVETPSDHFIVQLTNTGNQALDITFPPDIDPASPQAGEFQVVNETCTVIDFLQPGEDCLAEVVWKPTTIGPLPFNANKLRFQTDVGFKTADLDGIGTSSGLAMTPGGPHPFGSIDVGTVSSPFSVTVTNVAASGVTDAHIGTVSLSSGPNSNEFQITNDPCSNTTLTPGAACVIDVVFAPTVLGGANTTLQVPSDDSFNPLLTKDFSGTGAASATAQVTPSTLDFLNVVVGTQSNSLTAQLTNTGNVPLTMTGPIVVSGAELAQFNIVNESCSSAGTLQPGEDCLAELVWTPASTAPLGVNTLDFPTSSGTVAAILAGTGIQSGISDDQSGAIAFGPITVGSTSAPTTVTISNASTTTALQIGNLQHIGVDVNNFNITNDTCSNASLVATTGTCAFDVDFTPTSVASFADTILIPNDSNDPNHSIALSGTGIANSIATVNPGSLAFGSQAVGSTSQARTVQLTNTGTTPLTVTSVGLGGTDPGEFAILNETCSSASPLPAGTDCLVEVQFAPTAATASSASLDFVTDGGSPSVSLSGTGTVSPLVFLDPTSLNFGSVRVGQTAGPLLTQLTNNGSTTLNISTVTLTGANPGEYAIFTDTCGGNAIAPGGSCVMLVTFSPTIIGVLLADLEITSDDPGSPDTVSLTGTGVQSAIGSDGPVTFTDIPVGTTAGPTLVTITNLSGDAPLNIGNLQQIGPDTANFTILNDNCSNQVVAAGGTNTCTFDVSFTPNADISYSDLVLVPNDSATPDFTVSLTGNGQSPGINRSPTSLTFLNVPVGSTSSAQTVTVSNTNTFAELHIGELIRVGGNTTNFAIINDACSNQTLSVSGGGSDTCTFDVVFSPNAATAFSAQVQIPSDDLNNPLVTVDLDGNGVAPSLSDDGDLTFTDIPVNTTSAPQMVTITNTSALAPVNIGELIQVGANTGNFTIINDNCSNQALSVNGGGSDNCTFQVTCTPTSVATFTDTVQIPSDDPASPLTVDLTCNGITSGLSAPLPVFPDTLVNTESAPVTITVSNGVFAAPANIGTVSIIDADADNFEITRDTCSNTTVVAGGSCDVDVKFKPDDTVTFTATLSIPSNATTSPLSVALTGNGVAPLLVISPSTQPFSYGDVPINDVSLAGVQTFTLSNNNLLDPNAQLIIGTISLIGTDIEGFEIIQDGCSNTTWGPGGSCIVRVRFAPINTGLQQAALSIPTNDPLSPVTEWDIEGTGIASALSVAPPSPWDFLTVPVDTASTPKTFTITNAALVAPLDIGQLELIGADPNSFAITADGCSNTTLAAAATCDFDVTFFPQDPVSYTATVTIPSNDPASPFSYTVTGTGLAPGIAAAPTSVAFGNQNVDTDSGAQTVVLSNNGTSALTITNAHIAGTNPDQFRISQDACSGQTLIPAGTCNLSFIFHPLSAGGKGASAVVINDDPNTPFLNIPLSGTGIIPGEAQGLFSPLVLDFDDVELGQTSVQRTTFTNVGTATMNITNSSIGGFDPGVFSQTNNCDGAALAAGASCVFNVTFAPGIQDNFNAVLLINSSASNSSELFVVLIGSSIPEGAFVNSSSSGCALGHGVAGGSPALLVGFLAVTGLMCAFRRRRH